jgi:hypothetical protein
MAPRRLTPDEIRSKGFEALSDALGPVDSMRFIQQFREGSGDYTRDRYKWLGRKSATEIYEELKRRREE